MSRQLVAWAAVWFAAGLLVAPAGAQQRSHNGGWQQTLERVASAVVVLRVSVPRAFDTQMAAAEMATGFVVDAKRGLILTNRHVVNPGPVVAEAVFLNHEEVEVKAVYRDPVHDFGLFRYDPNDVEFMQPGELQLVPEHATVGTEIRVVGNDAGEKLSILSGTLARLDREAPVYGRDGYNDFNTFYYQAASATSGGSSGSPVVDEHGHVVALNAGGNRRASSSYYLPLDRVVRALEQVRAGRVVTRGTLQTVFLQRPYDELRRLGLRPETEADLRERFPDQTGLLVVDEVVPGGPAYGELEVGDVLLGVAEVDSPSFVDLEALLDEKVGGTVSLRIERGGLAMQTTLGVGDLHAISPAEYLEMGGGVVHALSYQQARNRGVPVQGLFVATAGYSLTRAGMSRGAVITAVDGQPVGTLDEFEQHWASLPDGANVALRFFDLAQPTAQSLALASVDRLWYPMARCVRNDAIGSWPCRPSPAAPARKAPPAASTTFRDDLARPMRDLAPSLVMVEFEVPFRIDGIHADRFKGAGLVVDAERGLVVVDRETVPISLGDVKLVFASSVEVPGEVIYIHPAHNLGVVAYDPSLLGDTPIRAARLESREIEANDELWIVGLNNEHEIVSRRSKVASITAPVLPMTSPPRFRESNLEVVLLVDPPSTVGGVLCDAKGRVHGFWGSFSAGGGIPPQSFFAGLSAQRIEEIVEPLRAGRKVAWRTLGAELHPLTLADARARGLSEVAARELERHGGGARRVLSVARVTRGLASSSDLQVGDLILAIDGDPVTEFEEVERAAQSGRVEVTVLRDGAEQRIPVSTTELSGRGTDRAIFWAGAVLQAPHLALAEQGSESTGVYVAWFWFGSPANRYGLAATRRIVAVDNQPVSDLDAFLGAVSGRPDRSSVRLKTVSLDGRIDVITLKLDLEFWPTSELRRNGGGWKRIPH